MSRDPSSEVLQASQRERWVLYALLRPAVRLAFVFGLPLVEVVELLETAYFHEARAHGLTQREAAELFSVSVRKVAQLSKQLRTHLVQPELEHGLHRRILFVLWTGATSEARLLQALADEEAVKVSGALAELVTSGQVVRESGRTVTFRLARGESRLVQDGWLARMDALENLLGSVGNVVFGRFFSQEPLSFARTLTLRIRERDLGALRGLYEDAIWGTLSRLDAAAADDPAARSLDFSVLWAPYEYVRRLIRDGELP